MGGGGGAVLTEAREGSCHLSCILFVLFGTNRDCNVIHLLDVLPSRHTSARNPRCMSVRGGKNDDRTLGTRLEARL